TTEGSLSTIPRPRT
ncbi:hypothetical protein CP061683_1408B, partial [Chlamydia psittaci 06-1683]